MKYLILFANLSAFALINFGSYTPNSFRAQSDTDGSTTKFDFNPFVSVDYIFPPFKGYYFNPEVGYVFNSDSNEEVSHKTIFIHYNFERPINAKLSLRTGLSTFIDKIGGDGKTVSRNNGSSTDDFYTPTESRSSYTTSLNFGIKFLIDKRWSARFDTYIARYLSSRRSFNHMLSVNFN